MLKSYFLNNKKRNFSTASIWIKGGSDMDSVGKKGINKILSSLLTRGCDGYNSFTLSEFIDSYGAELNQEVFEDGVNKYVDMYVGNQVDIDAEKEKLGENADARLDAVNSWASSIFSPEQYEAISSTLGQSVDGIEALEKMMNMNKQTISNAQNFTQPERPLTIEDVRSMMKDKRYFDPKERDESYVRKVDDAFARLYRG